jgi:hypothetical protein
MFRKMIWLLSVVLLAVLSSSAPAGFIDDSSLVIYYSFDSVSDIVTDQSGNGHDGVVNGDVTAEPVGKYSGAGNFASGSFLDLDGENFPAGEVPITGMTLAAWIKCDDTGGDHAIFNARASDSTWLIHPEARSNGQFRWLLRTAGGTTIFDIRAGAVTWGEWQHFAGTYDKAAGKATLYINGEMIHEESISNAADIAGDWGQGARVGYNVDSARPFTGLMDDFLIFRRALSLAEVNKLMQGIGSPLAFGPTPADGSLHAETWANVGWYPGDSAASHDVYFSDDFEAVNDGAAEAFQGNQTEAFIVVGFPGFAFPDGLIPGTTYYWRIDEVNDAEPNSPWTGRVWSFMIPPKTAYYPIPADGTDSVATDGELSWTAGFGAKLHTVYFGDTFDQVSNDSGGGAQGSTSYTPGSLESGKIYFWRVDEFDAVDTYKGEVWSFSTVGAVGSPNPANGAADVKQPVILEWVAGDNTTSYVVYFGDDYEAVTIPTDGLTQGHTSYTPGPIELEKVYYWRIDEVKADGTVQKGLIWSFTTANFLVVDDFESYNDINEGEEGSNRIYNAWVDGYEDPTNGSTVGHPFAEQKIVHSDGQSMPLEYDNSAGNSDATMTVTYPRDWTVNNIGILTIWFRGDPANAAELMYVALNGSAVVYNDNPAAAQISTWNQWDIDLGRFADQGVNLANVNTISLGFGDKSNPQAGGPGMVFFDDIRLYPSEPEPDPEPEADPSLVIYYSFDEVGDIVVDQSGKGHDGVVMGAVTAEADGKIGGAANFATGSYLDLDGPSIPAEDIPTSAMTLAAWIKIANTGGDHEIFSARASDESWLIHPEPKSSGDIRWLLRSYGGATIFQIRAGTVTWDEWLHFAGTYDKDSGKAALYINGELIEEMDVTSPADIAGDWDLGARVGLTIDDGRPFTGLMDEFRMYTRALSQDEILEIMQGM